ncbi:hypothetical protein ALC53_01801 [Atta colombica]|uniref:Uncharacterized protein n=1 Tax=Atta colombica TaxID=520822 RepID=A0A151I615_9HYME|nr:hypothetical protein ALC53_01801 [Atta colombica]
MRRTCGLTAWPVRLPSRDHSRIPGVQTKSSRGTHTICQNGDVSRQSRRGAALGHGAARPAATSDIGVGDEKRELTELAALASADEIDIRKCLTTLVNTSQQCQYNRVDWPIQHGLET